MRGIFYVVAGIATQNEFMHLPVADDELAHKAPATNLV